MRDFANAHIIKKRIVNKRITGYARPKNGNIFNVFGWTYGARYAINSPKRQMNVSTFKSDENRSIFLRILPIFALIEKEFLLCFR